MKKLLVTVSFFLFLAVSVYPQSPAPSYIAKPRLSAGAEFAVPSGSYGNLFSIGFGGSAKFEVPVTRELYLSGTAGFTTFYLKENGTAPNINKSYVPLKGGVKYYLAPFFYGEGELGISIGTIRNAGSALLWSPGIGVSLPLTDDSYLDAGIRYERWARPGGNINQTGIRVSYKF
jgi:hypothetical protein